MQQDHARSGHPLPENEPLNTLNTQNKIGSFDGEAVSVPVSSTLHPSHSSGAKNQVLQQEDVLKIEKARLRILWAPLAFALSAETLFWMNRKLQPRKLFANPFKTADDNNHAQHQSRSRSMRGLFIVTGMVATVFISLFLKEIQEANMYSKYRPYVDSYAFLKLYNEKQDFLMRNFKDE